MATGVWSQTPEPGTRFDVVSVKACKEGATPASGGRGGSAGGALQFHQPCTSVRNLILTAYYAYSDGKSHPPPFPPLDGGPGWIDSASYSIDATSDAPARLGTMRGPMLQLALEDRFQLKIHREMREGAAYSLVAGKNSPKLQAYHEGDCVDIGAVKPLVERAPQHVPGERPVLCGMNRTRNKPGAGLQVLDVPGTTLDYFCKVFLGIAFGDRPVINRTGLDGLYNIHLEFAPDESTPGPTGIPPGGEAAALAGPSIFVAIQQQLGLKLEPTKGSREFLIIDSIQRPTEN